VDAGIHHQPGGAEQEALDHADPAQRLGAVEPHLVSQRLGIETPAFREGGDAGGAVEHRNVRRGVDDRALPQMARHRLVRGQRRQAEARARAHVLEVDVEDAGARAGNVGRLRVGAGRADLDRHRHAARLHRAGRQ
jgi:hypothetical protein